MHAADARRWRRRDRREEGQVQGDVVLVGADDSNEVQFQRDEVGGVRRLTVRDLQVELKAWNEQRVRVERTAYFFAVDLDQIENESSIHEGETIVDEECQRAVQLRAVDLAVDAVALRVVLSVE